MPVTFIELFDVVVLDHLKKYARLIDLINLSFTCKTFQKRLRVLDSVKYQLEKYWSIWKFPKEYLQLDFVKETGGILSGSFVMGLLTNNYYTNSDLDIFLLQTNENQSTVSDWFTQMHSKNSSSEFSSKYRFVAEKSYGFYPGGMYIRECSIWNNGSSTFNDVIRDGLKIQFIFLDPTRYSKGLYEFVKTFDLDFCKNAITWNADRLYSFNIFSVTTSQCTLNLEQHLENYTKYFQLDDFKILKKLKERLIKYRNRGYTINVVDSNDILSAC